MSNREGSFVPQVVDSQDEPLSLFEFFSELFVPLNKISLPIKPAHKLVCDTLQDALIGALGKQYVVLNIPPRIGKTKILEAAACWLAAYFPDAQTLFTSFSSLLVERSIRYIAMTLRAPWFIELFGAECKLGPICNSELVTTSAGGNIYGAGLDGTITGFGAGLKRQCGGFIAVDDPAKPTEALSAAVAANVREVFELTLKSRRNSDEFCPIIICAQRLAKDDLCGYVLATYPGDCVHIKIPALAKDDQGNDISNFPETYTVENLIAARDSVETNIRFAFWSQMQQEPISLGGNLIPVDKIHRWDLAEIHNIKWEKRLITCDTALKTKEHNDFSCLQLWGKRDGRAHLIDMVHGKWESPELLANARLFWEKHTKYNPHTERGTIGYAPIPRFVIEEKAAGTGLGQQMRKIGIPVEGIERQTDKVTRVKEILGFVETGLVYAPRDGQAPWLGKFFSELSEFSADGKAAHDDITDCFADAVFLMLGKPTSIFDVLMKKPQTIPGPPTAPE